MLQIQSENYEQRKKLHVKGKDEGSAMTSMQILHRLITLA